MGVTGCENMGNFLLLFWAAEWAFRFPARYCTFITGLDGRATHLVTYLNKDLWLQSVIRLFFNKFELRDRLRSGNKFLA